MSLDITYSLRDHGSSAAYYTAVASFTDVVLAEAPGFIESAVEAMMRYLRSTGREAPRTEAEYTLDLLTLGTLWRVYSRNAQGLRRTPQRILTRLAGWRRRYAFAKPGIDLLRGIMSTAFLTGDSRVPVIIPGRQSFDRLLAWLDATGEFRQEVDRLRLWRCFFTEERGPDVSAILSRAIAFGAWFETQSQEAIGSYTANVERFLREDHPRRHWREDVVFSGRRRVEYHLNMVGAEIMNRAYREEFQRAKSKLVLVPGCMRLMPAGKCVAKPTQGGLHCSGCTPRCRVGQLTRLGREHGFEVLIVSHESGVFAPGMRRDLKREDVGVLGVACVANLVSGGWQAKSLGIPAQCVLLNYAGCKKHWHRQGIPTDIDVNHFKKVVGIGCHSGAPAQA